jgi:hypothetical protein
LQNRAKALLIVIGNPYVLIQDTNWGKFITHCITNNAYKGCKPPPLNEDLAMNRLLDIFVQMRVTEEMQGGNARGNNIRMSNVEGEEGPEWRSY